MNDPTSNAARRIELILQQIDALPTLPAVAMRLLQITSAEDTDARQVIELVKSDPSLTTKVLSLCRSAAHGVRQPALTIDRAVVLLGFEAIRNAVLSIKVFETFAGEASDDAGDGPRFDHAAFWRHSLGVAVAAELIAQRHGQHNQLKPAEAFVCGLLHDIGKLALEYVLPRSYQRVIELTEQTHGNIAKVERKVLGIDHHTAGKRLAEKWGLCHMLGDCIWLHGARYHSLPDLEHRRMVGLIGLADLLARRQHIGYSGNHAIDETVEARAEQLDLEAHRVDEVRCEIHEELERRARALGVGPMPDRKLFVESIMQANAVLGRLNAQLDSQRRHASQRGRAIGAITQFHAQQTGPARSVAEVLSAVVTSAGGVLGEGRYAVIHQGGHRSQWQVSQFNADGRLVRSQLADPPPNLPELSALAQRDELPVGWMGVLPWLADYLVGFEDLRHVRLLALPCAWGTAAVLVHDQPELPEPEQLQALAATWGAAIGAAAQHEGAHRLAEQLAEANRALTETQEALLEHESMARLGEMAAGAAHEMNNPLAVISGRAQLLSMNLPRQSKEQADAAMIFDHAQKLSDLITALHLFAEPPRPTVVDAGLVDVLERAWDMMQQRYPEAPPIDGQSLEHAPAVRSDPEHLAQVVAELLVNAHEAAPRTAVRVNAQVDPLDDRLMLQVIDDGTGMDEPTLEHAFDPFYSRKPAGRQTGLGLARAQRLVEALDGRIVLSSTPDHGTTATVELPLADPHGHATAQPASRTSDRPAEPTSGEDRAAHPPPNQAQT
jgi:signal transduction histidine kinase/HD-like signal output (HDOD) protein